MKQFQVRFVPDEVVVATNGEDNLVVVAARAGITLRGACGGAGHCGRCRVLLHSGQAVEGDTIRVAGDDPLAVLACRSRPLSDLTVEIPEESRLREHRVVLDDALGSSIAEKDEDGCWPCSPLYQVVDIKLSAPSSDDVVDDWARLLDAMGKRNPIGLWHVDLDVLRALPMTLRRSNWQVAVGLTQADESAVITTIEDVGSKGAVLGLALDIGTTTLAGQLVDLNSGRVISGAGTHNRQAAFGEDVITRIIYAVEEPGGLRRLQEEGAAGVNALVGKMLHRCGRSPRDIRTVVCAGNPTMTHLLLGVDPACLRKEPHVPAANRWPMVKAASLGLDVHPNGLVYMVPGVSGFLGGDIVAGAVAAGMDVCEELTLFLDVGTNGEMLLGNRDWLVGCSCSAGPAFEGGGIRCGMRAVAGAIERIWVADGGYEVLWRTVDGAPAVGLCGSGLIGLVAALRRAGVVDRAGRFYSGLYTPRLRPSDDGPEFVLAWPSETSNGMTITVTEADIGQVVRAKAAVFAGIRAMLSSVGLALQDVQRIIIGGGFGRYVDLQDAVSIGLLPDLLRERYTYLGNTALRGARAALLSREARLRMADMARRTTYLDLDIGTSFMDEYMQALFLPHTNTALFPSVGQEAKGIKG